MQLSASLLGLALLASALAAPAARPNVVLFYADDMGYGEIQRFHPEASKVPTPHLNQLCDEGMMFTDAHTSASVCTPSRYSLLTGRYNWRSTHQSRVVGGGKPCLIAPDRMTLASLFKEQGYKTAMFGKWHLNFEYDTPKDAKKKKREQDKWNIGSPVGTRIVDGPVTRGFDYFLGFHHSGSMSSLIENDKTIEYVDCREMMDRLTSSVVSYIDENAAKSDEEPFFLYYPMNSPHAPVVPKEEWKGRGGIEGEYPEFVAQTDDAVGQVLAAIERNGLKENTIVIFGTDNGCHQAPSKFLKFGHSVSGPLRAQKASIHDGGHRIPFIVRWSEVVQAGTKSDQLICMTDIFATFSEYFAYDYANNTAEDSISFLPVLHGKEPKLVRENIVHHDIMGHFAVRSGDWKLILMPDKKAKGVKGKAAEFQLYNMQDDIAETKNLANEYPEKVETLLALLKQQIADGRSTPGELQQNDAEVDLWKKDSKR